MKTVLITGSTSGIGQATALLFAKNGFHVIVNGRNEKRGQEVVNEIISNGGKADLILADVTKNDQVEKLFTQIKELEGSLDVLVNNAGSVEGIDDFYKSVTSDLIAGFETDFFSAFYCSQQAVKIMKTGAIVNVGSVCGLQDNPVGESELIPIYSAAKAALHNFTQNLAKTLAPNIRVNVVIPGYTKTPIWGDALSKQEEERLSQQTLMKRFGTAEEVAEAIWLLATNEAMTGSRVIIDGGLQLK